jgi:hypothetical protein
MVVKDSIPDDVLFRARNEKMRISILMFMAQATNWVIHGFDLV